VVVVDNGRTIIVTAMLRVVSLYTWCAGSGVGWLACRLALALALAFAFVATFHSLNISYVLFLSSFIATL
jgi:hypothetical protein